MKNKSTIFIALAALAMGASVPVCAQDSLEISGEIALVSRYVWRGECDSNGATFAPWIDFSFKGFTLEASGQTAITNIDSREIDFSLSYSVGNFDFMVMDYFYGGDGAAFGNFKKNHDLELSATFTFERFPLSIGWNTFVAGNDEEEKNEDGDRMFSTYINFTYEHETKAGFTLIPAVGITPWEGRYSDGFDFVDVSLRTQKVFDITEGIKLPIYVDFILAPANDDAYLVGGIALQF